MNGTNLKKWTLTLVLAVFTIASTQAVNIWPDKLEPPVSLAEALQLGKQKTRQIETDNLYCLNATLLNGENGDTSMGYWLIGFSTELGNSYSVAVRMDARVSVRKVKSFRIKTEHSWPETITPPVSVENALSKAIGLLRKENNKTYFCLNATLVTGSDDVVKDGMWNFVFQTESDDPKMVNIRMNGKTAVKAVDQIKKVQAGN